MINLLRLLVLFLFSACAFAQSDGDASLSAAAKLMFQGELAKAVEILAPLANEGNPAAQHNLAMIYARGGSGIEQDFGKALTWYRAAAKLRFIPSIHNLGVMYQLGQGVQPDYARAKQQYLVAGQFGYAPALASTAFLFANGLGQSRDYIDAYTYLLNADVFGGQNVKQGLTRLRSVLTPDEVQQAEIVAAGLLKRYRANIKDCWRLIARRNNQPFDESLLPTSGLLIACELPLPTQAEFQLPRDVVLLSAERTLSNIHVVGLAKDNMAVSAFLRAATSTPDTKVDLHEIVATTGCGKRASRFTVTVGSNLKLPAPHLSEMAACEALFLNEKQ